MDAQFERRLLLSMNGQSSLQSLSPFKSPIQSPVKTSDRYIPLRSSLSSTNLHYPISTPAISSSVTSLSNQSCSLATISPNKKRKYEQNQIGLGPGVTASEPDLAMYRQLLQNTLLNTNVDSMLNMSDTHHVNQENMKTIISKKSSINKENSSLPSTPIFRYSERADTHVSTSTLINKHHFTRSPMSNASVHLLYSPKKSIRRIPKVPYKVLDAPDLQDDFYLNLIDWSSSNVLSVGLGACVYLCNAQTNNVQLLCDLTHTQLPTASNNHSSIVGSDTVTSVAWADWSNVLAVGKISSQLRSIRAMTCIDFRTCSSK
jgi:cell division cycle 20-like protein 1, cofactor of APC complex